MRWTIHGQIAAGKGETKMKHSCWRWPPAPCPSSLIVVAELGRSRTIWCRRFGAGRFDAADLVPDDLVPWDDLVPDDLVPFFLY